LSPNGRSFDAETQALVTTMIQVFNRELQAGLSDSSGALPYGVIVYDSYTRAEAVAADPTKFGFTNTTSPACAPVALAGIAEAANAIICNTSTLIPGDTSRYAYADMVHATPYAHRLDAEHAMSLMVEAGWQ
jgi:phospholipase/lecithinase/hemolysin